MSIPQLAAAEPQPSPRALGPRKPWWQAFGLADLLHLTIAALLIYKQRMALEMMGIAPGPGNLLASAGVTLLITALVRRASGRWQGLLWLLISGLLSLLIYADVVYFRQFGDLVSVAAMRQIHQLSTVGDSVTALIQPGDLWFFADLPPLAALLLLPSAHARRWFARRSWPAVLGAAALGLLAATCVASTDPLLTAKYYGHSNVGSRLGLLNYHAFDLGEFAGKMAVRLKPQTREIAAIQDWFAAKKRGGGVVLASGQTPGPVVNPFSGLAAGKNVIVVQLESFQSFPLGMTIAGQEVTPNLNRLMGESLYFPNFYTQTGQGVTSDADLLANCSLFPTRTGAVYYDYAGNDFRCLPGVLKEQGYETVAMQGIAPDFWNLAAVYPRIGFDRYDSERAYDTGEQIGLGVSDESFLRQSVEKLKALPEPYYAFLVTLTSHGPFDFENMPHELSLGSLEGTKAGNYLQAVHYTDRAVGQFIDQLKAEGLLDRAVLLVYGDHMGVSRHDEAMDQLGLAEDPVGQLQMEKRVPLLIRLPEGTHAGEYAEAAGQVDLAPTVAGLLGLPGDQALFMGRDLLATAGGVVPFYRGSAVDDTHLYLSPDDASESEGGLCYRLDTGEPTDVEACASLRDRSAEQLRISRLLVERNLVPAVLKAMED